MTARQPLTLPALTDEQREQQRREAIADYDRRRWCEFLDAWAAQDRPDNRHRDERLRYTPW